MKTIRTALLTLATILFASQALAHGDGQVEGRHGGMVATANDLNYELAATPEGLVLYINDHGQAFDLTHASGKVTLLSAGKKQEAVLAPEDGRLAAKGSFNLGSGTKAIAIVDLPGRGSQTVRFLQK